MAGLETFGFKRKTFSEIETSIQDRISNSLGQTFNFTSDSIITKLVANVSLELDEQYQALEGLVNARTINGAEGVYLDELLSSLGVVREGASAATDTVMVGVDESGPSTQTIDDTYTFSSSVGDFKVVEDTLIGNINTSAVFVPLTDNVGTDNNISITLTGREGTNVIFSLVSTPSTTESEWEGILQSLVNTVRDSLALTPDERNLCFFTTGEGAYIGFDSSSNVDRLGVNLTFNISLNTTGAANELKFTKYSPVPVKASLAGFKDLDFGDINGLSPSPTGFVSVRNIGAIFRGSENETDAAYRIRAQRIKFKANNSTRASIEAALLAINGISQVRIYENPTDTDRPEALANTFNTVVLGGDAITITDLLFNKKPINSLTSGETFDEKTIPGGLTEKVYYTPAKQQQYEVLVEYKTRDNLPITKAQAGLISSQIAGITDIAEIGDKVENDSLKGIVYGIVGFTKLDKVVVKLKGPLDGSFTVKDLSLNFDEYLVITDSNISIVQVFV